LNHRQEQPETNAARIALYQRYSMRVHVRGVAEDFARSDFGRPEDEYGFDDCVNMLYDDAQCCDEHDLSMQYVFIDAEEARLAIVLCKELDEMFDALGTNRRLADYVGSPHWMRVRKAASDLLQCMRKWEGIEIERWYSDNTNRNAIYNLARDSQREKPELAIALFHESLEKEIDHVTTHQLLGQLYFEVGKLRSALRHLAKVLRKQPENSSARITCAMVLIKAGHLKFARTVIEPIGAVPARLRRFIEGDVEAQKVFEL
jgi:tetratricopeptide (TPR) repeat protein